MSKINVISLEAAQGKAKELLSGAKQKIGMVPNLFGVLANSPAVLETYLNATNLLSTGKLSPKVREQLAITVATKNRCEYCLSAHTAIGKMTGVTKEDLEAAQTAEASDAKSQAVLTLATVLNETHGDGSNATAAFDGARKSGLTDEEILEVAAHVAVNILTNTVNGIAQTAVDFPKVALR